MVVIQAIGLPMIERGYYIETSVWGMVPKGQARELRQATLQFLNRVPRPPYFVSKVVLDEIAAAPEKDQTQIMRSLKATSPELIEVTPEAQHLARFYIELGIVPERKNDDALHVAVSTIHEMDVLVSWNHRHMANVRKTEQYRGANLMRGYRHTPLILTPLEVLNE